jgi:hypothetical protein
MSKTSGATIHRVFEVYESVFDMLEGGIHDLEHKKIQWKVDMRTALEQALKKAKHYYSKTSSPAGQLYALATCLNPMVKLSLYSEWDQLEKEETQGYSPAADP